MLRSQPVPDSVAVHCKGYRALIINNAIPDSWRSTEFFSTVDTLIALQWTGRTDSLLTELLSYIKNENQSSDQCRLSPPSLKCLITPRPPALISHMSPNALTSSKQQQSSRQPQSVILALRLGISVLQLSPSHSTSHQYVHQHNNKNKTNREGNLISKSMEGNRVDMQEAGIVSRKLRLKETLLYHKFGIGTLKLIPIFLRPNGTSQSTSSFSALFVWYPAGRPSCTGHSLRCVKGKYFLYSPNFDVSPKSATTKRSNSCFVLGSRTTKRVDPKVTDAMRTIPDIQASKNLTMLVKQLSNVIPRPLPLTSLHRTISGTTPRKLRSGLSQSQTFTAGLSRVSRVPENLIVELPNVQIDKTTSALNHIGHTDAAFSSNIGTCASMHMHRKQNSGQKYQLNLIQDLPTDGTSSDTTGCESEVSSMLKATQDKNFRNVRVQSKNEEFVQEQTDLNISTRKSIISNEMINLSDECMFPSCTQADMKTSLMGSMPKSPSCPTGLNPDVLEQSTHSIAVTAPSPPSSNFNSPRRPSTVWPDISSMAFSATVLLAIPEVGEADYYAESPQCLTVADLRAMGLYDDSDDSDESECDNTCEAELGDHPGRQLGDDLADDGQQIESGSEDGRCPSQSSSSTILSQMDTFALFRQTTPRSEMPQEEVEPLC